MRTIHDGSPPTQVVIPISGAVTIKRKPENGGDKAYNAVEEMFADFASMSLHPGDLKPAIKDSSMLPPD